jgi:hypothetical protein
MPNTFSNSPGLNSRFSTWPVADRRTYFEPAAEEEARAMDWQLEVEAPAHSDGEGINTIFPSWTNASTASPEVLARKSVPRTPITAMGVFSR